MSITYDIAIREDALETITRDDLIDLVSERDFLRMEIDRVKSKLTRISRQLMEESQILGDP